MKRNDVPGKVSEDSQSDQSEPADSCRLGGFLRERLKVRLMDG